MNDALDPIAAFADEARRYCALIEDDSVVDPRVFAQRCLLQVVRLYERALLLPVIDSDIELLDKIEHDEWAKHMQAVGRRLTRDYYWEVFEPLAEDQPEAIRGSLSDDLADIWRDVKRGILAIDHGQSASVGDVVWHWRFHFENHWGHHAVEAIAALHALCVSFDDDATENHEGH